METDLNKQWLWGGMGWKGGGGRSGCKGMHGVEKLCSEGWLSGLDRMDMEGNYQERKR